MNSNEILNKYINLIDKGYCSDCNELNCIDNFPHSKITHAIRELQQENKKYKEVIDKEINDLDIIIDIVREKPFGDRWIINRLEANKNILKEVE